MKLVVKKGEYLTKANTWEMINSMSCSWIMNMIDPKLHPRIAYVDITHKMWEKLQKRYSVPNVVYIHQLKADIASCKHGKQDMVEFFQ